MKNPACYKKTLIVATIVLSGFVFGSPRHSSAKAYDDFVVNDFSANYYVTKEDPQGRIHATEKIDVVFPEAKHGFLRAIPYSYKGHKLNVKINSVFSPSGAPTGFTTYNDNGNVVLKIGDSNQTVVGEQTYQIDYTLQNVIGFYKDHDELYWDVNGTGWSQQFTHVSLRLYLPDGLKQTKVACYMGQQGSTNQDCTIAERDNEIDYSTNSPLQAHQTLTIVAAFPKSYFKSPSILDYIKDNSTAIIYFLVLPVSLGGASFIYWLKRGRDAKGRGVIVPEYEPPDNLDPLEVGVIADFKVDNRDISATFIDLAIRGYIIISEVTEKKLLTFKKHYTFSLKNTDFSQLTDFEKTILGGVFKKYQLATLPGQAVQSTTVNLDELRGFNLEAQKIRTTISEQLTAEKYFSSNPLNSGRVLGIITAVGFAGMYLFSRLLNLQGQNFGALIIGGIVSVAIVRVFIKLMPSRTLKGAIAKEKILGLKLYLESAEKDRLQVLQGTKSVYITRGSEPIKTVKLYEKLLPFAIVLGVETEWSKQFENIFTTPPAWYNGSWTTFNATAFGSSISETAHLMGTSFAPPSSASGSGFSGGNGFSGGGGGGGGGGSW